MMQRTADSTYNINKKNLTLVNVQQRAGIRREQSSLLNPETQVTQAFYCSRSHSAQARRRQNNCGVQDACNLRDLLHLAEVVAEGGWWPFGGQHHVCTVSTAC